MLTEIAITPQALSQPTGNDLKRLGEILWELAHRMMPLKGVLPVIVSDLYGNTWQHEMPSTEEVRAIADHRIREKIQRLLIIIKDRLLVTRPARGDWPETELDWVSEALLSSQDVPITKILTSADCKPDASLGTAVETIGANDHFWDSVGTEWDAPMDLDKQIEHLRPICVHAKWICFVSNYALGSEKIFVRHLIRSALERPIDWPSVGVIDVHTDKDYAYLADTFTDALSRNLSSRVSEDPPIVRVFFWLGKKCKERKLLAGGLSGSSSRPSARWGVSTPHVMFGTDEPEDPTAPWTLASSERTGKWFREFYDPSSGRCCCPNEPRTVRIEPRSID